MTKFSAKLNKTAWEIRRQAAQRFNCKIMSISWKICLKQAKIEFTQNDIKARTQMAIDFFKAEMEYNKWSKRQIKIALRYLLQRKDINIPAKTKINLQLAVKKWTITGMQFYIEQALYPVNYQPFTL